jgi:hypothetical protein
MTSRDGINWNRGLEYPGLLRVLKKSSGPEKLYNMPGIIERNGEFYFYDCEHYWHSQLMSAVILSQTSLCVFFSTKSRRGVHNKILYTNSRCLKLNYRTSAYGSIDIDLVKETGETVNICKNLYGNELVKEISLRLNPDVYT